jgi:hypothetical protein
MKNITIAIALKIAPAMLNAADVYFPSAISPGIIVKSTMSMISIMIPHAVLLMLESFLFLLDERCDVDHDDDEEEAHENRATDEECNMPFAVCGLR